MSAQQQTYVTRSDSALVQLGIQLGSKLKVVLESQNVVIELIGDVGAGKTTLTRGIAKGLGIDDEVTSPSFTICKKYAFASGTLSHYDFYRLPDPGIMSEEISEAIAEPHALVIVEWGSSVSNLLPEERIIIEILSLANQSRQVKISCPDNSPICAEA